MLLNFVEEIENNVENDKYNHGQLKKLAEASPKILESCGKATMPWVKEGGEKSTALEKAKIDVAGKVLVKLNSEGAENIDTSALKSIISYMLSEMKSKIDGYIFYTNDKNLKLKTEEEKKEFINRDKYFTEAIDVFFEVVKNIDKDKSSIIEKIRGLFSNFLNNFS